LVLQDIPPPLIEEPAAVQEDKGGKKDKDKGKKGKR